MSSTHESTQEITVVLVHGAFADSSSWNGVIERLQAKGIKVTAAVNPLRGIAIDSAYVAGIFEQTPGPVLAVGHSYGGAVITNAAAQAENVVGLVFVAAFAPDEGETLGDIEAGSKDSILNPGPRPDQLSRGERRQRQASSSRSTRRRSTTRSLPTFRPSRTALMAATQRPVADLAFGEPTTASAWKHLPFVGRGRQRRQGGRRDVIRAEAERAGAKITEVEGSHVIMISQPETVTDVILELSASVGSETMAGTTA
jgi:pimeloyl-ACP methyl ester carboxylesterase